MVNKNKASLYVSMPKTYCSGEQWKAQKSKYSLYTIVHYGMCMSTYGEGEGKGSERIPKKLIL